MTHTSVMDCRLEGPDRTGGDKPWMQAAVRDSWDADTRGRVSVQVQVSHKDANEVQASSLVAIRIDA